MDRFIAGAAHLAARVADAHSRRAFFAALADFERMLTPTDGHPAGGLSVDDLEALHTLADAVVEHIEARVDARLETEAVERQLVDGIYRIRSGVEAIYRSRVHDAAAGHPSLNAAAAAAVTPST